MLRSRFWAHNCHFIFLLLTACQSESVFSFCSLCVLTLLLLLLLLPSCAKPGTIPVRLVCLYEVLSAGQPLPPLSLGWERSPYPSLSAACRPARACVGSRVQLPADGRPATKESGELTSVGGRACQRSCLVTLMQYVGTAYISVPSLHLLLVVPK